MSSSTSSFSSSVGSSVTVDGVPRFPDRIEEYSDWVVIMRASLQSRGLWSAVTKGVSGMPTLIRLDNDGKEIDDDYGQSYNDDVEQIRFEKY